MKTFLLFDGHSLKAIDPAELTAYRQMPLYEITDVAQLFEAIPVLYRCIDMRARAVASVPFTCRPARYQPAIASLLYPTEVSLCLHGAAYWLRGNGTMRFLAARTIRPLYDEQQGLAGFQRTIGRTTLRLSRDEVIYFWLPAVEAEVGPGPAPAAVALRACRLAAGMTEYMASFFERGTILPVILSTEGYPPEGELRRLETWWQRLASGVRSAWSAIALRGSVKPEVIGVAPDRLALPDVSSAIRQEIATALGVPISLLGEQANYATALTQRRSFYDETVLPETELIAAKLREQANIEVMFEPHGLMVYQSQLPDAAGAVATLIGVGVIDAEEARFILGLPPKKERPQQTAPPPEQLPPVSTRPTGETVTAPREEWRAPSEERATPRKFSTKAALYDLERWAKKVERGHGTTFESTDIPESLRSIVLKRLPQEGPGAFGFLKISHTSAEQELAAALEQLFTSYLEGLDEYEDLASFDYVKLEDDIFAALVPIIFSIALDAALHAILELGLDIDLDEVYQQMAAWARQYARDLSRLLAGNTRDMMALVPDVPDWQRFLEPVFGAARIERIAATEVTRALSEGVMAAERYLRELGLETRLVWVTARDERVCPICGALDGTTRDVWAEQFPAGPPAHVHCRCDLVMRR